MHLKLCDVASLESVRAFATEHEASGRPLHVLVNNAGMMVCDVLLPPVILHSSACSRPAGLVSGRESVLGEFQVKNIKRAFDWCLESTLFFAHMPQSSSVESASGM